MGDIRMDYIKEFERWISSDKVSDETKKELSSYDEEAKKLYCQDENTGKYGTDGFWFQDEVNADLAVILKDCLAYNFLEKQPTIQGKKDQKWTVFYLNSWLCAYSQLPLRRGGWRKVSLPKLKKWVNS